MQGSRCNRQWGGIIRDNSLFLLKGPGADALLGFPVVEVTAVLPSLGGLSQGRLCTGLERSRAQTERLWILPGQPHVLSDPSSWQFSMVSSQHPLRGSYLYFRLFCPMSLVGLRRGPPHLPEVPMCGASRGLAGPHYTKQVGLRPWLGSKPCSYPLFFAFVPPGRPFTDS